MERVDDQLGGQGDDEGVQLELGHEEAVDKRRSVAPTAMTMQDKPEGRG